MNALIVSSSDKVFATVAAVLRICGDYSLARADNARQAREFALGRRFDIAVVVADGRDAECRDVAVSLSENGCGTVYVPAGGIDDGMIGMYDSGVQLVGKPVTRMSLYGAVKTAAWLSRKMEKLASENASLKERIATVTAAGRAKCLLMERGMTEQEAHREIERRAMDERRTRLEVASDIIERNDYGQ